MSNCIKAFTATPRPRSESAFVVLGAGYGAGTSASPAFGAQWTDQWPHGEGMSMLGRPGGVVQPNPNRDRVVIAAKPGSPPRGNPR